MDTVKYIGENNSSHDVNKTKYICILCVKIYLKKKIYFLTIELNPNIDKNVFYFCIKVLTFYTVCDFSRYSVLFRSYSIVANTYVPKFDLHKNKDNIN